MRACYSAAMLKRQSPLPRIWIVSDARNDAVLERALLRLPRGSGLVFRHYHLAAQERRKRFASLKRIARRSQHLVALSAHPTTARRWGADAAYGPLRLLAQGPAVLRLITAHSMREIAQARRARANAVLLSPAFPTRSHPGAKVLGPLRFRLLAKCAGVPVIALGGMNAHRAKHIGASRWAAIDSFCGETSRLIRKDS
jgi:thiamine-phosphate pyrophosphorylase